MRAANALRVVRSGRGADEQETTRRGRRRIRTVSARAGIETVNSQEARQSIRVPGGKRIVRGEKYLFSKVGIRTRCPDVNLFRRGAFPIVICGIASRAC